MWNDINVFYIRKTAPFFSQSTQTIMQKYCTFLIYKLYSLIDRKLIEFNNNYNISYIKDSNNIINKLIKKASKYNDYIYQKPDNEIKKVNLSYPSQYEGYYAYFSKK